MCVVCRPESKADTQPRNEVRSVVSAGPSCQRRRKASNHSPGLLDSFPGAVAPAPAKFSDSTTAERRAWAATRWQHGRARQTCPQPAAVVSDQSVLPVSSAVSVRRNVACEMKAVQKWPISRLFLVSCPCVASRANALSSATGGASRRNAVTWPDEVTRPIAGRGRYAEHRGFWNPQFSGAHDVF
jgi:hypothetical protein